MHPEILTKEQNDLLPLVGKFSDDFGLVGGTAIALHLGHRRSIDFDLFSREGFGNQSILNKLSAFGHPEAVIVNKLDELTLVLKGVKITFFHYPYPIDFSESYGYRVRMPDLLTLAAMKAFALGQRAKWKDYADLFFIMRGRHPIGEISKKSVQIFGDLYDEKLFRSQLSYFDGIDYREAVEYMPGFEVSDEEIKRTLTALSVSEG